MAEDSFNIGNLEAAAASMNKVHSVSEQAASQIRDMNTTMQNFVETSARIGSVGELFDPNSVREIMEMMDELLTSMVAIGGSHTEHLAYRKAELALIKEEVGYWDQILKKSGAVASGQRGVVKGGAEAAKSGKKAEEIEEKKLKLQEKQVGWVRKQAQAMSGFIQSNAQVQLSLVGILALILDIHNESNRMTAMQKQYAAQWDYIPRRMGVASSLMSEIRGNFGKTYEEIGPYLNSLAQAGLSMEQMQQLSTEILAIQELQGQAVGEQVAKIKQLVNDFGQTGEEAQSYLSTIRLAATAMREEGGIVISMQEAVNLTTELADKTKVYNTDLLGTLALFNALSRKDVAERLGLGDAPLKVRQEIAKTVTGFSAELEDGWKAALGEGASAAARILEFEKLLPPQQFERMAEFITEKTRGFQGEQRELAIRQLLKQFGFTSKEVQTVMARAFQAGGLSGEGLRGVMQEINKQREGMANLEQKAAQQRAELIEAGKSVSQGMISLQERLARKIRDVLRPLVRDIVVAIEGLIDAINDLISLEFGKRVGRKAYELMHPHGTEAERGVRTAELFRRTGAHRRFMKEIGPTGLAGEIRDIPEVAQIAMRKLKRTPGLGAHEAKTMATELLSLHYKDVVGEAKFKDTVKMLREGSVKEAVEMIRDVLSKEVKVSKAIKQEYASSGYVDLRKMMKED
jgi:hypothetical protein